MKYSIKRKAQDRVLLLFHGTGGNEEDLFEIGNFIDNQATLIGFRGEVDENGMLRFFKRKAMGVFDLDDLKVRTETLYNEIKAVLVREGLKEADAVAIGYSNGANILASLLFTYGSFLKAHVLLHPMVPRRDLTLKALKKAPIFIGAGVNDPICPQDETKELVSMLEGAGGELSVYWHEAGHSLTNDEIVEVKKFLGKL